MMKALYIPVLFATLVGVAAAHTALGPNTSVTFEKGKATLTEDSKKALSLLVTKAREAGEVESIRVAAWSDNPAPREGEELKKADRALAEKRTEAIKAYLNTLDVTDIDTYNMAEKASWLSRLFHTDGAELKTEIGRGGTSPTSREEFDVFKANGDAGKAVLVTLLKRS